MPKILSIDQVASAALRRILLMPSEKTDRASVATSDLHYAIFLLSFPPFFLDLGIRNISSIEFDLLPFFSPNIINLISWIN